MILLGTDTPVDLYHSWPGQRGSYDEIIIKDITLASTSSISQFFSHCGHGDA